MKRPLIKLSDIISVAFETNGKGYIGFIIELPGAFIRGKTKKEAIAKVDQEVNTYLKWICDMQIHFYKTQVIQKHQSTLLVEDADNEILLDADREKIEEEEFRNLINLAWHSGETFLQLYTNAKLKEWIDEERIRKTFYGDNPKTILEVFNHVKECQYYYLSRTEIEFKKIEEEFMRIRRFCFKKMEELYHQDNNSVIYKVDNELWTLKKILRRFIWHDRIHGKAIARILEKQKKQGVINEYEDPFHFKEAASYNNG